MIIKVIKKTFDNNKEMPESFNESVILLEQIDWHITFPIFGEIEDLESFIQIVNASLLESHRVNEKNKELLEYISSGKISLGPIKTFQNCVRDKFKIVNRQVIITDKGFDQFPYATSLLKVINNNPQACLRAYLIGVNNYVMEKFRIMRALKSGCKKGRIRTPSSCAKACAKDKDKIISLTNQNLPIPHYLGCMCYIEPIVEF